MLHLPKVNPHNDRLGVSLAEVTLALGVASLGLITILGLLPIGLHTNHDAIQRLLAENLMSAVIVDLRGARAIVPGETITSRQFGVSIPTFVHTSIITSTLFFAETGEFSASSTASSRCRLTIRFLPKIETYGVIEVELEGTWPAEAAPANAAGRAEMFVALDHG